MWKIKHSLTFVMLSDAVILGASSVKHLEENLKSSKNGRLHEGELILRLVWKKIVMPGIAVASNKLRSSLYELFVNHCLACFCPTETHFESSSLCFQ